MQQRIEETNLVISNSNFEDRLQMFFCMFVCKIAKYLIDVRMFASWCDCRITVENGRLEKGNARFKYLNFRRII